MAELHVENGIQIENGISPIPTDDFYPKITDKFTN